jgi:hypothetical protein
MGIMSALPYPLSSTSAVSCGMTWKWRRIIDTEFAGAQIGYEVRPRRGNMAGKTTKADLIEAIHNNGNLNYKVHGLIDALFDEIKDAILAGKTVELRGFGAFEVKKRKGRKRARNPYR